MANSASNFFFGSEGREHQFQRFNPQQQSAFSQLLGQGMMNAGPQGQEDRARRQFNTQTIPSIAERFTSFGGANNSNRGSSEFTGALGSAGADLESQLASLRSQYGLQQTQLGLTPQTENAYFQRQPGFLENAGIGLAQGAGQALASPISSGLSVLGGGISSGWEALMQNPQVKQFIQLLQQGRGGQ